MHKVGRGGFQGMHGCEVGIKVGIGGTGMSGKEQLNATEGGESGKIFQEVGSKLLDIRKYHCHCGIDKRRIIHVRAG